MASELPTNALSQLAASVKSIVTSQVDNDEKVDDVNVEVKGAKKADKIKTKTVEAHDDGTTVHKQKTAAVTHEDVKSHEHEKVDTVVDKEVHQDHYHTTIQPVKDRNVLPTEHVYQENAIEEEVDHRDNKAKKQAAKEAAQIRDETLVEDTTHSKEVAPTKENEHVHHHIHETIQPVIERETIHQKVIHTTNKIHETEHLNDEHHKATVAPPVTLAEFEKETGAKTEAIAAKGVSDKKHATRSSGVDIEIPVSEVKKVQSEKAVKATSKDVDMEDVVDTTK